MLKPAHSVNASFFLHYCRLVKELSSAERETLMGRVDAEIDVSLGLPCLANQNQPPLYCQAYDQAYAAAFKKIEFNRETGEINGKYAANKKEPMRNNKDRPYAYQVAYQQAYLNVSPSSLPLEPITPLPFEEIERDRGRLQAEIDISIGLAKQNMVNRSLTYQMVYERTYSVKKAASMVADDKRAPSAVSKKRANENEETIESDHNKHQKTSPAFSSAQTLPMDLPPRAMLSELPSANWQQFALLAPPSSYDEVISLLGDDQHLEEDTHYELKSLFL